MSTEHKHLLTMGKVWCSQWSAFQLKKEADEQIRRRSYQLSPRHAIKVNWTLAANCKLGGNSSGRTEDTHLCRRIGTETHVFVHFGSNMLFTDSWEKYIPIVCTRCPPICTHNPYCHFVLDGAQNWPPELLWSLRARMAFNSPRILAKLQFALSPPA